jgi:phospholipid/cholesterol/gamma-HCH transport system substrate-binding protein
VVLGVALGVTGALVLSARSLNKQSVDYKSFFDESVQGLDVGSPVKFRGVTIGSVSAIDVAPDRRHVAVTSALTVDQINLMGLATGKGKKIKISVPPGLRVQLASAGITGVKFLQLDFFSVKSSPLPDLPFPVPENYIPTEVSTMKSLEDSVVHAVDRLPEIADQAMRLMAKVDTILDEVQGKHLPDRAERVLGHADTALANLGTMLGQVDVRKLSAQAASSLEHLDGAISRMNGVLARVDGEHGVLANAERASSALGDVASNVGGLPDDLASTLQNVQQAADSIQRLADALERDSDMLLKGRAKAAR